MQAIVVDLSYVAMQRIEGTLQCATAGRERKQERERRQKRDERGWWLWRVETRLALQAAQTRAQAATPPQPHPAPARVTRQAARLRPPGSHAPAPAPVLHARENLVHSQILVALCLVVLVLAAAERLDDAGDNEDARTDGQARKQLAHVCLQSRGGWSEWQQRVCGGVA